MLLFNPIDHQDSTQLKKLHALYELALTAMSALAALLFLIGSILFFFAPLETLAIWFFVIGSLFFLFHPMLKLVRELHYAKVGNLEKLATRIEKT